MASLTKIMTCILTLFLSRKYHIDLSTPVKISRKAVSMLGTSAQLQAGDKISVKDLLYGLMLPSGNDSAFALAEYFGRALY
jgi:D-alanyl-D-alanine carboxypeptidase